MGERPPRNSSSSDAPAKVTLDEMEEKALEVEIPVGNITAVAAKTRRLLREALDKRLLTSHYGPDFWCDEDGKPKAADPPSSRWLLDLAVLVTPQAGQLNLDYIAYIVHALGGSQGQSMVVLWSFCVPQRHRQQASPVSAG